MALSNKAKQQKQAKKANKRKTQVEAKKKTLLRMNQAKIQAEKHSCCDHDHDHEHHHH